MNYKLYISSDAVATAVRQVESIHTQNLTLDGQALLVKIKSIREYTDLRKNQGKKDEKPAKKRNCSKTFMERFPEFYEKFGEHFKQSLLHNLLINFMNFTEKDYLASKGEM
eukprot:10777743-Ditylum_brightwellii.AAC.1